MSDAQDKSAAEQTTTTTDAVEEEIIMDEVAEERPVTSKKSGFTGFLVVLVLLGAGAGAGWYYQAMWWPQVQDGFAQTKDKMQQAKTWVNSLMPSDEEHDVMAAPESKVETSNSAETVSKPNYVVSAISEPAPIVTKQPIAVVLDEAKETKKEVVATEQVNEVAETLADIEKPKTATEEIMIAKVEPVVPEVMVAEATKSNVATLISEIPVAKQGSQVKAKPNVVDLAGARQAFWQRDLPKAEALYKEQIKNSQVNKDSWGELGNIYYFQAKWKQAASAYTEAALILLDKGDYPQAMFLRYIVMGLDPVQTRRIDERLQALQAPL